MALKYGLHNVFTVMIKQLKYADEESEDDEDERTGIYCRSMTDGIDTYEVLKYINKVRDYIVSDGRGKISRVIGLPLTLERILVALNKQDENYAYSNGKIMLLDVRDEENDYHNKIICEWQPNKTLENQSEETIKTIYNILCV